MLEPESRRVYFATRPLFCNPHARDTGRPLSTLTATHRWCACVHAPNSHIKASPPTHSHHEKYREGGGRGHARARRRAARPGLPPPSSSSPSPHPISIPSRPQPRATRPATGPSTGNGERENERERGQPVSLSCSARPVSQSPPSPPLPPSPPSLHLPWAAGASQVGAMMHAE